MERVGVGSIIQKELEKRKMSQKELAKKVNVTEAAMSRYVSGEREPRGALLVSIANALGLSTDFLLGNFFQAPQETDNAYDVMLEYAAHKGRFLRPDQKAQIVQMLFEEA